VEKAGCEQKRAVKQVAYISERHNIWVSSGVGWPKHRPIMPLRGSFGCAIGERYSGVDVMVVWR
jgi:hypothetical protein